MGPHYYKGLDNSGDYDVNIHLSMREVAEYVAEANFGIHRLLSHLIDVRREMLAERIAGYRECGDDDVAEYAEKAGDKWADAFEALLNTGIY